MEFIYNIALKLFGLLLYIISPINVKVRQWTNGRKNIFQKIQSQLKNNEQRVWFHAASLGEFEQGRPIIEALKLEAPNLKIVLTFFSPSGYEIQKNYAFADYVFYLPNDTKKNAKKFIELINPKYVVFIKYEFWYNYLKTLNKLNIKTYLISAIFRKNQIFFRWYGKQYSKMLSYFTYFFVQNEESKQLLNSLNYNNVEITGDTRFDRVYEISKNVKKIPKINEFCENSTVFVAGSSWKADENIFIKYINNNNKLKYIIAPHEINDNNINRIINSIKLKTIKYSIINNINIAEYQVLIIDNIGLLSSLYQYGNIAYIGGGFGSGIHNVLEAATFGLPTIFGINYKKYMEAVELIKKNAAFSISDYNSFEEVMNNLLSDSNKYNKSVKNAKKYVEDNRGAKDMIVNFLTKK